MKKFLQNLLIYFSLLVAVFLCSLYFVPNKLLRGSSYMSILDKHTMMKKEKSGKIIFTGGSNVSHGIDSKSLSVNLNKKVVNYGLHAAYGLSFILNDLAPYVKEGDLVVIMPEYAQFYGNFYYGSTDLLQVLFDINPEAKKKIPLTQWIHLLKYMPQYASSKLYNYLVKKNTGENQFPIAYRRSSYNEYGDASAHWNIHKSAVVPYKKTKENFNPSVIVFLNEYIKKIKAKKADVVVIFPAYQNSSFLNCVDEINEVKQKIKDLNCRVLGTPEMFCFANSMFYDSPYHLNRTGLNARTRILTGLIQTYLHE